MAVDIVDILRERKMTKICAPMVRYSKLAFRSLVRRYDCDLCFTPMILADSFVQSAQARDNEFATNRLDEPLVVQFAANNPDDFANAAEMVSSYCNGVDLNCGCPQRWAMKAGYGSDLLNKPQLVADMVRRVRNRIPGPFSVSAKIRLDKDIGKTIELCRILEKCGLSFLTVHARTPQMRKEPIDVEGLKAVVEAVNIPVIGNGDVKSLREAEELYKSCECDGIMVANGLLTNPGLFAGHAMTPLSVVEEWLELTRVVPTTYLCMHHHLVFMLEKVLPKSQKMIFNNLQNRRSVVDFLQDHFGFEESKFLNSSLAPTLCTYDSSFSRKILPSKIINDQFADDFFTNLFSET